MLSVQFHTFSPTPAQVFDFPGGPLGIANGQMGIPANRDYITSSNEI